MEIMSKMMITRSGFYPPSQTIFVSFYLLRTVTRFDYSKDFLTWALTPPGYIKDWHVGVRSEKTGALLACITGIPAVIRVHDAVMNMCEINFLCVHKRLRSNRLAPVLIKEVTRRVNLTDTWQAVYTAGVVLPRPIGKCRYYHRSLNPKKLIEVC